MSILYDARNNEWQGNLDQIIGQTVTDARTASSSLSALNAEGVLDLNGHATVLFYVQSIGVATLVFEGTIDGTNYLTLPVISVSSGQFVISTTAVGAFIANVSGYRRIRVRCSAYTSGTAVVFARATVADVIVTTLPKAAELVISGTAAANTGVTLTLPAAGAGLFHYITQINITRNATAALAGTATLVITTTNLPGTLAWSVGNAMAAGGTQIDVNISFANPLKCSVANTNTTIVMPAPGAAVLWRGNCHYYVGP